MADVDRNLKVVLCILLAARIASAVGGDDLLLGHKGKDFLHGGTSNDRLDGGPGTDTCQQGAGTGKRISCESR